MAHIPIISEMPHGALHCANQWPTWKTMLRHHPSTLLVIGHVKEDDLLLGIVPWLRLCRAAGLAVEYNGRQIDFNQPAFWAHFLRAIAYREGMGDALAEGGRRAPAILGFGQELAEPLYAAWGSAGHWDGHGDRANRIAGMVCP